MAASNTSTWDDTGNLRRPTLDDLGGAIMEDKSSPRAPLKDGRHFYAAQQNQRAHQAYAAGRMIPMLRITVLTGPSAPALVAIQQPGTLIQVSDITFTDTGVGDVTVHILKTKLPPLTCDAEAAAGSSSAQRTAVQEYDGTTAPTEHRWRLRLFNAAGAAVDGRVNLTIH